MNYVDELMSHSSPAGEEWFESYAPERKAAYLEAARKRCEESEAKLTAAIDNRDIAHLSASLHCSNIVSRKFFTFRTGVVLPKTERGTTEALRQWIGAATWNQYQADCEAAYQAKLEAEKLAEAEKLKAVCLEICERIKADREVSGDELVKACRHLNIAVHPRTAGVAGKIEAMTSTYYRFRRTGSFQSVFQLHRDCRNALCEL